MLGNVSYILSDSQILVELLKLRDKLEEKLFFVTAPLGNLTKTAKAINEHWINFFFNENIWSKRTAEKVGDPQLNFLDFVCG